jgi:hypothetical protein
MRGWWIVGVVLGALVGYVLVQELPQLKRYVKMESM